MSTQIQWNYKNIVRVLLNSCLEFNDSITAFIFYLLIKHAPVCVWSYVHVYEHVPRPNTTHRQLGEVPGEQTDRAEETYLLGPLPGSPTAGTHGAFTLTGLHPLIPPCTFSMIWGFAYVKKELMWTFGPHDTCSNLPVLAGKADLGMWALSVTFCTERLVATLMSS